MHGPQGKSQFLHRLLCYSCDCIVLSMSRSATPNGSLQMGGGHLERPIWCGLCGRAVIQKILEILLFSFENDNAHTNTPGPMYTNCIPPFRLKCEMCGGGLGTVHGGARGNPIIVWLTLGFIVVLIWNPFGMTLGSF